jgi:hypothetical protein
MPTYDGSSRTYWRQACRGYHDRIQKTVFCIERATTRRIEKLGQRCRGMKGCIGGLATTKLHLVEELWGSWAGTETYEKAVLDTPLRSSSASQRGIEQTHDEVDQRILEEQVCLHTQPRKDKSIRCERKGVTVLPCCKQFY